MRIPTPVLLTLVTTTLAWSKLVPTDAARALAATADVLFDMDLDNAPYRARHGRIERGFGRAVNDLA